MSDAESSQRSPRSDQRDWSGFVSAMLAFSTVAVVATAKAITIGVAGGIAALFLVFWALYFAHPRIEVVES